MQGVFLDYGTLGAQKLDDTFLKEALDHWDFYQLSAEKDIFERIQDAQIVVTNKVPFTRETLQATTGLKLICVAATEVDIIDLLAAREYGIEVCNVPGYASTEIAERTITFLLMLQAKILHYDNTVKQGHWSYNHQFAFFDKPFSVLRGKKLGIIGFGQTGKKVAELASVFGLEILKAERPGCVLRSGYVPFETVLETADIISLHCPLTPENQHLINQYTLSLMKPEAILLNTARGGLIDEPALANALKQGKLSGAGLDGLEVEPPPLDHPLLQSDIPNIILTPHNAWAAIENRQKLLNHLARNISSFLKGVPINIVN